MSNEHTFVGFGFGPIQAGLFACEARRSGRFGRIVVVEIDDEPVTAVRENDHAYAINIAGPDGIETVSVPDVALLNPGVSDQRRQILEALAQATEIATALPSVDCFDLGASSVAGLLAEGLAMQRGARATLVYAGENHNHAAEILEAAVRAHGTRFARPVQFLNTVIGKMSQVVRDPGAIAAWGLTPIAPGFPRAFLVESFNHILVTRGRIEGFEPGIACFEEKDDLLPFEEAKLYGHNAVHALLGYLLEAQGATEMADASENGELMAFAREAFLEESGAALCRKYEGIDALFTKTGWRAYADDLLERMVNPYLRDAVARVTRDPLRKLGWDDRLIGTMRLVLGQGIRPERFARGARCALQKLAGERAVSTESLASELWPGQEPEARKRILEWLSAAG